MRISDWSSDVCSSDLGPPILGPRIVRPLPDAAVDHEMGDMDALRCQFARQALRQAAQRELAHGERGGAGVALDARRSAGEQETAAAVRDHLPGGGLRHEEAAEAGTPKRLFDLRGYDFGHRTERAIRSEERRVGKECDSPCRSRW